MGDLIENSTQEIDPWRTELTGHVEDNLAVFLPGQIWLNTQEQYEIMVGAALPEEKIVSRHIKPLDQPVLDLGVRPHGQFR